MKARTTPLGCILLRAGLALVALNPCSALGATTIVTWGNSAYGQAGTPASLTGVVAVAAGRLHSLALREDGTVIAWGDNSAGQTSVPPDATNVQAIAAADYANIALKGDGTVVGWGFNTYNPGWSGVVTVAEGGGHHLALREDGTVVASGYNGAGQVTIPVGLIDAIGVAAGGNHSLVLKVDGTVLAWGHNDSGQAKVPPGLTGVVAIAAGFAHNLTLKEDGTVVAWGNNDSGQASPPVGLTNVVAIAAGLQHSLALRSDGTVVGWGDNNDGQSTVPPGLSNVVAISAGMSHSMALVNDGSPFIVKQPVNHRGYSGQATVLGTVAVGLMPLTYQWRFNGSEIDGATNASLALNESASADGGSYTVVVSNALGSTTSSAAVLTVVESPPVIVVQPTSQTATLRSTPCLAVVAAGSGPLTYRWQSAGVDMEGATNASLSFTNVQWTEAGDYRVVLTNPYGSLASSVATLSLGHTRVVAWGALWVVDGVETNVPPGLTNVVAVSAGYTHNLALKEDGSVVAWGSNWAGQTDVPQGLSDVVGIAAGGSHSVVVRADGTIASWGDNTYNQLGVPASATNVVAVAAGYDHSLALRNDGSVVGWGRNNWGQASVPPGLAHVVAVAAAGGFSMALKANGSIVTWSGLANDPAVVSSASSEVVAIAARDSQRLALRADESLAVLFGDHSYYALFPEGLSNVLTMTSGHYQSLAVLRDDRIIAWGDNSVPEVPEGFSNVVAISAGTGYNLALLNDGSPFVVRQPANRMVADRRPVQLSAGVSSPRPLSYQWGFNAKALEGATNAILTLPDVTRADSGYYALTASNALGTVTTKALFLNIMDIGNALDATNLTWTAGGGSHWFWEDTLTHDGVAAMQSGRVTNQQESIVRTRALGPGTMSFWWKVSSFGNSGVLAFSIDDVEQERISGEVDWQPRTYYLSDGEHALEWRYVAGSAIAGQDAGWLDQVNYSLGPTLPTLTTFPTNQTLSAGDDAVLASAAFGTPPLSYQWHFNGAEIPGATNLTLNLSNVQAGDAGAYSVRVSNGYGIAESTAILTVSPALPTILVHPVSDWLPYHATAVFEVAVRGSEPIVYQWQVDGANLDGATNSVLTLSDLGPDNSGDYRVVVSNAYGSVVSFDARLRATPTALVVWGESPLRQIPVPQALTNPVGIAAGVYHNLALKPDTTVVAWGDNGFGQSTVPAGLSNVIALSAGRLHSLALKTDGTLVVWGGSPHGETNLPANGRSNIVAISAGYYHSLALKGDGTVIGWGDNRAGQCDVPSGLSNIVAIAGGGSHSLALNSEGTVIAWGYGAIGQTNVPPGLTNVVAITAGTMHSVALERDGTVVAWGYNQLGQTNVPAGLRDVVAIDAGGLHTLALKRDGTVVAWGDKRLDQTEVPARLSNGVAVGGGDYHSLVLLGDGSPFVVRQPFAQTVLVRTSAVLSVVALGKAPLAYAWSHNGTNILGATNSSLILTDLQVANSGRYRCVVRNALGTATTTPAILNVLRTTPRFDPPSLRPGREGFALQLRGLSASGGVVVFASTNLRAWEPILTNGPTTGALEVLDSLATNLPLRFYSAEEW